MPQHLDPILEKYMKQQRMQKFWGMLSEMGQGLMEANRRGESPIRGLTAGLSAGMAQGGSGIDDLLPILSAQNYLTKARREQRQFNARDMLSSGILDAARQPAMRRYDESGALLPSGVGAPPDLSPGRGLLDRAKPGLLGRAYPEAMGKAMVAEMFPKPQERYETVENPFGRGGYGQRSTKTGRVVGYQQPGGGPTDAQVAGNREIDQARVLLQELERDTPSGVSLSEELQRRMSARDPATGRLAPDYKSYWGRIGWLAMQNKVGVNDPDQTRWSRLLVMPPQFSDPAGMQPLPPGVSAEQPGLLQRGYNALFGDGGASQPSPPGVGTATPRAPGPRGPRGRGPARRTGSAAPIQRMTTQEIDDLINQRGDTLSPAELRAIQTRLKALGL